MAKLVNATITIGKLTLTNFTEFSLQESIFAHHSFKIVCPADAFQDIDPFAKTKTLIGERCAISVSNYDITEDSLSFMGLITEVSVQKFNGYIGDIVIHGYSPTIVMDNAPHCKTWEAKNIKTVVQDVASVFAGNEVGFQINPKYKTILPYVVQYKETAWQFLNRMAATFGEWLFYNGKQIVFGVSEAETCQLVFGSNLNQFSLAMQLRPNGFSQVSYNYTNDKVTALNPTDVSNQAGLNDLGKFAYNKSKDFFTTNPKSYSPQSHLHPLDTKVNNTAAAEGSSQIRFNGSSTKFGVQVGQVVSINGYGKYQVIEVQHICDGQGTYYNNFVAIPESLQVPPVTNYIAPNSETQSAVVVENYDTQGFGRVRVRFHWMNNNERSPWIRISNTHAGGGKGQFFIPEIGEEVMVGFEGDDPHKPFVLGTVYNNSGKTGFANAGNDVKAIQTRSGTKVVMNDAQGSVYIEDPSGNSWLMDGKGNIHVSAPKRIVMTATDVEINAFNNLEINVSNNMIINAVKKLFVFTANLNQVVSGFMNLFSGKALINSEHEMKIVSPDTHLEGQDKLFLHSDKVVTANSKGTIALDGEKGNNLSNKAVSSTPPPVEKIVLALIEFRTMTTYKGEFGFDWLRIDEGTLMPDTPYASILDNGYEKPNTVTGKTPAGKPIYADPNTIYEAGEVFPALEAKYKQIPINKTSTTVTKYYVPWLNLFPKSASDAVTVGVKPPFEATLKILVDVEGPDEPDQIRVVFNKTYFEINSKDGTDANPVLLTDKVIGVKRVASDTLNIKCIGEFGTNQEIKVYAYPKGSLAKTAAEQLTLRKVAGKIIVCANKNDKKIKNRKEQKFIFVKIKTNINGGVASNTGSFTTGEKENMQHALHQALIYGKIEDYTSELDLTSDANFQIRTNATTGVKTYGKFIYNKAVLDPTGTQQTTDGFVFEDYANAGMFKYLRTTFLALPGNSPKYINHFTVFCFDEKPYDYFAYPTGGYTTTLGQIQKIGQKNLVLFGIRDNETLPHEALHGLGLFHTHQDDAVYESDRKFTYNKYTTTNIMSYKDASVPTGDKLTTWHWQWQIVKSHVK